MQVDHQKEEMAAPVEIGPGGEIIPAREQRVATERSGRLSRFLQNRKAVMGIAILCLFLPWALFGPWIAPGDPNAFVAKPHLPPSAQHLFGTTGQGQDVYRQMAWGTGASLGLGLMVGILATIIGAIIGMSAAYFGGRVDDALSMITNIFLVIPGLPLLVALAAFLPSGPMTIVLVLAATGWAGTARVLRSQTLSLREKDFVSASLVSGDRSLYIMFVEILPNMASIVVGCLFGSVTYGISAQAGLAFLGLGDLSMVSWGSILYWASNNSSLIRGAWWTFVPPGLSIALVAFALAMLNYALDSVTNPRLRTETEISNALRKRLARAGRATPVIRKTA